MMPGRGTETALATAGRLNMWTRSPNSATCWMVNPHLVRVLGSSTEVYLRTHPERTFELTEEMFELLASFANARCLHEVLPNATRAQMRVVSGLLENGLLVPAHTEPRRMEAPRARAAATRFAGAEPLIKHSKASLEGSLVMLGAKFETGTLERYRKGAGQGPDVLRQESNYCPLVPDLRTGQVLGFPEVESRRYYAPGLRLLDAGDVHGAAGVPSLLWMQGLREELLDLKERHAKVLLLGGDHSVTAAAIQAHAGAPLGVLHLDAHADFGIIEYEGHITHANVMRHVLGERHVAHVVCCGLRGFQPLPELEGTERHRGLSVAALRRLGPSELDDLLRRDLPYYVSVDINVLDAPLVPGTAVPEPDGLGVLELRTLLRRILTGRTVVAADVVEVQSDSLANLTARCALQVCFELLDLMHTRGTG